MTKCQSSQNRFVQAALTAVALAFALTALPGTALADALPEDQQQIAPVEEQETLVTEESDGQNTPVVEDQVDDNNDDQVTDTVDDQETNDTEDVQEVVTDTSEVPATDDVADDQGSSDAVETDEVVSQDAANLDAGDGVVVKADAVGEPALLSTPGYEGGESETTIPEEYALSGNTYYIGSGLDDMTAAKFLDVAGGKVASGTNVHAYTYNGSNAQKWEFTWDGVNGAYAIYLAGTDHAYALGLSTEVASSMCNVQLDEAKGLKTQLWVLLKQASGAYTIGSFDNPAYVLDIAGGKYVNSTNVHLYNKNGSMAQSFYLFDTSAGPDTMSEQEGLSGNTYLIQTSLNGVTGTQVVEVAGGKAANSSNIQTYTFNNTNAQKWDFRWDAVNGAYIVGLHGTNFSYVLDVSGGVAANGRNIQIYQANGSAAQLWHVIKVGGTYTLASYINSGFAIDIAGAKYANSTNVHLYNKNESPAQSFYLINAIPDVEGDAPGEEGEWQGVWTASSNKDKTYALDIAGGSYSNSANVQLYTGNGTAAQRFYLEPTGDGYYIITVIGTGKVLDVSGARLIPGTNVQQYTRNESEAQKWAVRVIDKANNTVTFINKGTGLVLDVAAGKMANSANIQGWTSNGSTAQQFVLMPASFITDDIYEIKSCKNTGSAIDIAGGSASSGALAQLYTDNDTLAQRFQVVTVGSNQYIIRTAASGGYLTGHARAEQVTQEGSKAKKDAHEFMPDVWQAVWNGTYFSLANANTGLVLDLPGGSVTNGTALQTWYKNASTAQHFFFVPASLLKDGLYEIHSGLSTSYNLDIAAGSTAAGANAQLYTDNSSMAQMYTIAKSGSGYKIVNFNSNLAITGGTTDGANVSQESFTGASTQLWVPAIADGGYVIFQNAADTSLVLDVAGNTAVNSANVEVGAADGSNGQKWKLDSVKTGWYKVNGHWQFISLDSRARFETDKYVSGKKIIDLGHYDVLYDLWRKVNGYKSGSLSPYSSKTKYLVVSGWDDCYLAVFVGVGDPKKAGYWQPLFGWNCGNGSRNVIDKDAQDQAAAEGRTTNWHWDPEWDYYMAEGNTAKNKASLDPVKFRYFIQMNTTTNYQMSVVPTNTGERWFTSVRLTLGYHSTITGNPNNELYRHVSHGCIRLDVNNAHILYGLMAPKGTKTVVNGVTYEGAGPGTRCIQLKRGSY